MSSTEVAKNDESNNLDVPPSNFEQVSKPTSEGDESDSSSDTDHKETAQFLKYFSKYDNLSVSSEVKELFKFITMFVPLPIQPEFKLKPFWLDYMPAIGEIDAFLKIRRPDKKTGNLGLTVLDEPASKQSDANAYDLQLRTVTKAPEVRDLKVKNIKEAHNDKKSVENWIENVNSIHKNKPPTSVLYSKSMPDTDLLMQEWPVNVEHLLLKINLPTAELNCSLEEYTDIICNILDIPIYQNKIQSLHVLFSLFAAFRDLTEFQAVSDSKDIHGELSSEQNVLNIPKASEINFLSADEHDTNEVIVDEKPDAVSSTQEKKPVSVSDVFGSDYSSLFDEKVERKQPKTLKTSFVSTFFNDDRSYLESSEMDKKAPFDNVSAKQTIEKGFKSKPRSDSKSVVNAILENKKSDAQIFGATDLSTHSFKSVGKHSVDELSVKPESDKEISADMMAGKVTSDQQDLLEENKSPEEGVFGTLEDTQLPSEDQKVSQDNLHLSESQKFVSDESNMNNIRTSISGEKSSSKLLESNVRPASSGAGSLQNQKIETGSVGSRKSVIASANASKLDVGKEGSELNESLVRPPSAGAEESMMNKNVKKGSISSKQSLQSRKFSRESVKSGRSVTASVRGKIADTGPVESKRGSVDVSNSKKSVLETEGINGNALQNVDSKHSVSEAVRENDVEIERKFSSNDKKFSVDSANADQKSLRDAQFQDNSDVFGRKSIESIHSKRASLKSDKFADNVSRKSVSAVEKKMSLGGHRSRISLSSKKSGQFEVIDKNSVTKVGSLSRIPESTKVSAANIETFDAHIQPSQDNVDESTSFKKRFSSASAGSKKLSDYKLYKDQTAENKNGVEDSLNNESEKKEPLQQSLVDDDEGVDKAIAADHEPLDKMSSDNAPENPLVIEDTGNRTMEGTNESTAPGNNDLGFTEDTPLETGNKDDDEEEFNF